MNANTFTSKNGKTYKRINKRKARNLYYASTHTECTRIYVVACNVRPVDNMMFPPFVLTFDRFERSFDSFVDEFEHFNCNNQLGRYAAFYIAE